LRSRAVDRFCVTVSAVRSFCVLLCDFFAEADDKTHDLYVCTASAFADSTLGIDPEYGHRNK
jgi:hypothetical protein